MPLISPPTFKAVSDKQMEIPQPAIKGLNLKDLEYEQDVNQSPYMLNMMYRNGAFSKRYGQEVYKDGNETIYSMVMYRGSLIRHIGTKIYKGNTELASGIVEQKGLFILFNQNLYYFCSNIYQYDGTTWSTVTPYIPTVTINRKPDGTGGSNSEAYNMIGTGFQNNFHGDGTSVNYYLTDKNLDSGASDVPKVTVDNVEWTHDETLATQHSFKVDYTNGKITLSEAAPNGTNNVEIIAYKHDDEWTSYHDQILGSKFYSCFGGNNNSRLFVAGGGKSTYYYSGVYDASYFPYTNYARVGNSADDITGFGQQYNVLLVFKPTEIFSLSYYQATSETTTSESQIGVGMFSSQVVNSSIGCDCPYTIQLINNQLTWYSSRNGVCTLVSTNIVDERNVRVISRNIERTNNFNVPGILDIKLTDGTTPLNESVVSADFDSKYFLVFPKEYKDVSGTLTAVDCGLCYMWDYQIAPYTVTSSSVTNPKDLAWFLFDHFYVKQFIRIDDELCYSSEQTNLVGKLIKLNNSFEDLDFDNDDHTDPIEAYYMTPFFQFDAVEYLKTIKNLYIQCRGDTATKIEVYYYTDESSDPTPDSDPINIGGRIWQQFDWDTFEWFTVNWANTFRRKCSLKKIQMASFFFRNNEVARDMSITHIALQYQIVKYIK